MSRMEWLLIPSTPAGRQAVGIHAWMIPGLVLDPLLPPGVIVILGLLSAALTSVMYFKLGAALGLGQKIALLSFRLLGLALVLLLLLQPSRIEKIPPNVFNRVTLVGIDNSKSMAQRDVEQGSRTQAARSLLAEANMIMANGEPAARNVRLFQFSESAVEIANASQVNASGATTKIHTSVSNILGSLRPTERARALILLSDGHDFELVNPAKTALLARARQIPIFAVPVGKLGKARDVSPRIINYEPYSYVKQRARISTALRLVGCELELINVQLLREGKVVQSQQLRAGEGRELLVNFDVIEPAVGQYEYEVYAVPLEGELDQANNRALTFLNVIDRQIQVLFLEGEPYWDTTFLQRSLMRNDKMNVDSIVQYAGGLARIVRKKPGEKAASIPTTLEAWGHYDIIILGRSLEKILGEVGLRQLQDYVGNHGGTVIFSRGRAFGGPLASNDLEPVIWSESTVEHARLIAAREGQSLAPFRLLANQEQDIGSYPDLISVRGVAECKPLAATLALAQPPGGGEPMPGLIYRRFGEGQVLSVSVDGLWRWAFNSKVEGGNTFFDRFWDQLLLWLMAGRDFIPADKSSVRASSANVPLGEKISYRGVLRAAATPGRDISLHFRFAGAEIDRVSLAALDPNAPDKLSAEYLPQKVGRYEAIAYFPDGSEQLTRFVVFDENLEQSEVAADVSYLRLLCESSGGRLVQPGELGPLLQELYAESVESTPQTRRSSAWDRVWVFWTIGVLFGADWLLRRRWGLC